MLVLQRCLLIQLVFIAVYLHSCEASSIYVGRHASGTRPEQQLTYKGCKDFDARKCQKIINWYGKVVCNPEDSSWAKSLVQICPATCGLCECKDNLGKLCLTLSSLCRSEGEMGNFLQHQCSKTCNTCDQALTGQKQLEMIGL
uniref:mRNA n=1 Tax=Oulactis sp. TaxID=2093647 RepID=A0A4U8YT35_OULSP|nr:mRNA [Oulactis sp. MM-2018]